MRAVATILRLGENLLGSLRSASRFLIFEDPRLQRRSLKSSVALILECNELAVIDVSRARLSGQLFVQLLPSSGTFPYIAVSLLNHC